MTNDALTMMQINTLKDEEIKQIEKTIININELFRKRFMLECF